MKRHDQNDWARGLFTLAVGTTATGLSNAVPGTPEIDLALIAIGMIFGLLTWMYMRQ